MIESTKIHLSADDRKTLHEWLNAPGRVIYQRVLHSQAAEKEVEAMKMILENNDLSKPDREELIAKARVLLAASNLFTQVLDKETDKLYLVTLQPEPVTK